MERLKELRLKNGLYQKDVAAILGVDRTTYVKYEKGDSQPSHEILSALADYFEVSVDYILGRTNYCTKYRETDEKIPDHFNGDEKAWRAFQRAEANDAKNEGAAINAVMMGEITFNDFTFAMHEETKDLPEETKEALLNMAKQFKRQLENNDKK